MLYIYSVYGNIIFKHNTYLPTVNVNGLFKYIAITY